MNNGRFKSQVVVYLDLREVPGVAFQCQLAHSCREVLLELLGRRLLLQLVWTCGYLCSVLACGLQHYLRKPALLLAGSQASDLHIRVEGAAERISV